MTEEQPRVVKVLEAHEELMQHVEHGGSRIRRLSLITLVVVGLLIAAYVYQIIIPFATGVTSVTVNLSDPALIGGEVVVLALALVWVYVALSDYRFALKLGRQVREIRGTEHKLMSKSGLTEEA